MRSEQIILGQLSFHIDHAPGQRQALRSGRRLRKQVFWLLPIVLLLFVGLLPIYERLSSEHRWLVRRAYGLVMGEDRLVEWLQFVALVMTALYAFRLAVLAGRERSIAIVPGGRHAVFVLTIVAVGALIAAAEEISWGQRVLQLETPESLNAVNDQRELNVHNIHGLRPYLNAAMIALSTILLAASLFRYRFTPKWLVPAFLVTPLYWLTRLGTERYEKYFVVRNGEWAELCLGLGICLLMRQTWIRVREQHRDRSGIEHEVISS